MPKLSATDGPSVDTIHRVDIAAEDIRKMSDEEIHDMLAKLRRNREAVSGGGARKQRQPREPRAQIVDDGSDIESDV